MFTIRKEDVLQALDNSHGVIFYGYVDITCTTWQASYVRFCCIAPDLDANGAEILAFLLQRYPLGDDQVSVWLKNAFLEHSDIYKLQAHIKHALGDVYQAITDYSEGELQVRVLKNFLEGLNVDDSIDIFEIKEVVGLKPNAPDMGGCNYQMFWQHEGNFYYLLIHRES